MRAFFFETTCAAALAVALSGCDKLQSLAGSDAGLDGGGGTPEGGSGGEPAGGSGGAPAGGNGGTPAGGSGGTPAGGSGGAPAGGEPAGGAPAGGEQAGGSGGVGGEGGSIAIGGEGGSGGIGGEGGSGGVAPPPSLTANVVWDDMGLTLELSGADLASTWYLGLAETGNGERGWYGEDCLAGVSNGLDVCHPMTATGGRLLNVGTLDAIVAGQTTLLGQPLEAGLTYVIIQGPAEMNRWRMGELVACYTFGQETAHYVEALGCTAL